MSSDEHRSIKLFDYNRLFLSRSFKDIAKKASKQGTFSEGKKAFSVFPPKDRCCCWAYVCVRKYSISSSRSPSFSVFSLPHPQSPRTTDEIVRQEASLCSASLFPPESLGPELVPRSDSFPFRKWMLARLHSQGWGGKLSDEE